MRNASSASEGIVWTTPTTPNMAASRLRRLGREHPERQAHGNARCERDEHEQQVLAG